MNKQSSGNVDTDLDEKYDTDGFDTDIDNQCIINDLDTEKERINSPRNHEDKSPPPPLPKLRNYGSANNSDIPKSRKNNQKKPWKRQQSTSHTQHSPNDNNNRTIRKHTGSNRSMSLSFSVSNFKLPRMGSITSRPTSVLKKVLRRMEYGQYDSKDINLSIRTTSLFACIGFLLSLLTLSLYYSLFFTTKWNLGLIYTTTILYGISKFTIYSCSLCRLYFTLSNSALQYSICIYITIICLVIIHLIISIAFCICFYFKWLLIAIYLGVAFYSFDIIFILILYILFTKRMFELFENTSSYIAKSKASAYHEKFKSGNQGMNSGTINTNYNNHNATQSFDFSADEFHELSPNGSVNKSNEDKNCQLTLKPFKKTASEDVIAPTPSPGGTPRFGATDTERGDRVNNLDAGGIEYAVTNNLSIQIEEIQDSDMGETALSPISLKSPSPRLVIAKSYSAEIIDLTPKNSNSCNGGNGMMVNKPETMDSNKLTTTRSRGASLSISGRGRADSADSAAPQLARENSQSKRELSRIKRETKKNYKKEKWKYYQKQQATGIHIRVCFENVSIYKN